MRRLRRACLSVLMVMCGRCVAQCVLAVQLCPVWRCVVLAASMNQNMTMRMTLN